MSHARLVYGHMVAEMTVSSTAAGSTHHSRRPQGRQGSERGMPLLQGVCTAFPDQLMP